MKCLIWPKPISLCLSRIWLQPSSGYSYGYGLGLLLRHKSSVPPSTPMEEQSIVPHSLPDPPHKNAEEPISSKPQNLALDMVPSLLHQQQQVDSLPTQEVSRSKEGPCQEPTTCNGETQTLALAPPPPGQEEKKAPALSKNAQKKLLKLERYQAKKAERKAFEKSQKLEEKEKRMKEWEEKLAAMSAEEQEAALKEKTEKKLARKERSNDRKSKMKQAMESGQNLVIDLEFADRMKPSELSSLVQQIMYSYAANGKAVVPTRLSLTGCTGEILGHLNKVSGFSNWLIHKHELSYLEAFQERKQDLVYLTADSDCLIDQLEESKIYIIGGLVDRNRWKGLTLEKAKSQGIATAKLPISEHMKLTGSMVLTVNQVVEIILRFLELKNWDMALRQVIPLRKRLNEDGDSDLDEPVSKTRHLDNSS